MQRLFSPPVVTGFVVLALGGLLVRGNSTPDTAAAEPDATTVAPKATATARPAKSAGKAKPLPDGVVPFRALAPADPDVRKRHAEIEKALQTRFTGKVEDVALQDAVKTLSDRGRFRVVIDTQALQDEGIMTDAILNGRFKDATVEQVLFRLLAPLGATFVIENEAVRITTKTRADDLLITRTYAVADLKTHFEPRANMLPVDWLKTAIQEETSGPWFDVDGVGGTMSALGDVLVVRQTQGVHREIAGLLAGLRLAKAGKIKRSLYFIRRKHYPHRKDAAIRTKLAERTSLTFKDVPLTKAMRDVEKKLGFTVVIDKQALSDEGTRTDTRVNRTFKNVTLRSALRNLLTPLALTPLVEEGTLVVTTNSKADEKLHSAIFDVSDLIKAGADDGAIVNMIQNETSGPWFDVDGVGGAIVSNRDLGVLIVRQSEKVQTEIAVLLSDLNAARVRAAAQNAKPVDPDAVEIRMYPLSATSLDGTIAKETVEAIKTFVAPQSWTRNDAAIRLVNDKLVVRQTHKVHKEIRKFLDKLSESPGLGPSPPGFGPGVLGLGGGGTSGVFSR